MQAAPVATGRIDPAHRPSTPGEISGIIDPGGYETEFGCPMAPVVPWRLSMQPVGIHPLAVPQQTEPHQLWMEVALVDPEVVGRQSESQLTWQQHAALLQTAQTENLRSKRCLGG